MYAIWLLPEKNSHYYLQKTIKKLSEKYDAPIFKPHLTVYGKVDVNIQFLKNVVNEIIFGIKPFFVKCSSVQHSNYLWKTVFLDFEENLSLKLINTRLKKNLNKFGKYKFNPHISLIYKKMNNAEKKNLVSKLYIKKKFLINRIVIVKFSQNIDEWKSFYVHYL